MSNFETREQWLTEAARHLTGLIGTRIGGMTWADLRVAFPDRDDANARTDAGVPANLRVSCSNPSNGIRNRVRGECVHPSVSRDDHWEIWISPKLDDVETVLLVLLHELIHATLEDWRRGANHGPRFWRLAKACGLGRPATTAVIAPTLDGQRLRRRLSGIAGALGEYPHAGVDFSAYSRSRRRQSTRNLKAECRMRGCGFKVRITRTWASQATPLCPVCEGLGVHSRTVVEMVDGFELCQLAGVPVSPTGEDDAAAVERAAVLRAEREERERQAREAAEEAARVAREEAERRAADARRQREAAQAAQAAEEALQLLRAANARAAGLGEAADLGVVEGQGVQNRYGDSEATRERRRAERNARPVPAFDGVEPGTETLRHLMGLALPGCLDGEQGMNDVEDAVRRYCDRHGMRPPGRFTLVQARNAGALAAPVEDDAPTEAPAPRARRRSARFANLDFD